MDFPLLKRKVSSCGIKLAGVTEPGDYCWARRDFQIGGEHRGRLQDVAYCFWQDRHDHGGQTDCGPGMVQQQRLERDPVAASWSGGDYQAPCLRRGGQASQSSRRDTFPGVWPEDPDRKGCWSTAKGTGLALQAGNSHWLNLTFDAIAQSVLLQGYTAFCFTIGDSVAAIFGLEDSVRPDAASTVKTLLDRGISVHIISGDDDSAVYSVAA